MYCTNLSGYLLETLAFHSYITCWQPYLIRVHEEPNDKQTEICTNSLTR